MQTRLWLVPGFLGTELYEVDGNRARKVWLDVRSAASAQTADLLTFGNLWRRITPGGLVDGLGYGYGSLWRFLTANAPAGWTVTAWPYDWRRPCLALAADLADAIASSAPMPDGDRIVCHSYGACVACAAWALLRQRGQEARVKRIVTIGGILSGSYATVKTWLQEEDSVNLLSLLGAWNPFRSPAGFGLGDSAGLAMALLRCFVSWPSTYDMLPDPSGADDPGDALRPAVWKADVWARAPVPPSAALLEASKGGYQTFRANPDNWPPPGVLVNVCGLGQTTPYRLEPAAMPGVSHLEYQVRNPTAPGINYLRTQLPSVAKTSRGDNRATVASQCRPGCQQVLVQGAHGDLTSHPVVLLNVLPLLSAPDGAVGASAAAPAPSWPSAPAGAR